jgi:hypothetical protein
MPTDESKQRCLARQRRWLAKLRRKVIAALGGICACCGEDIYTFLTIEHVGGWGKEHRASLGVNTSGGRQVLMDIIRLNYDRTKFEVRCFNCNLSTKRGNPCAHTLIDYSRYIGGGC